tara:strand:+ start:93 stop:434 length:342 start_codon:yes stop_codon:yes gene_type:complete
MNLVLSAAEKKERLAGKGWQLFLDPDFGHLDYEVEVIDEGAFDVASAAKSLARRVVPREEILRLYSDGKRSFGKGTFGIYETIQESLLSEMGIETQIINRVPEVLVEIPEEAS